MSEISSGNAWPIFDREGLSFAARLLHPGMAKLFGYWERLSDGAVPSYRRFDPLEVVPYLPDLQVTRREPDGRFRIGLTGDRVISIVGQNSTGKRLDEAIPPAAYAPRAALFSRCLDTGCPLAYSSYFVTRDASHRVQKRLLLPFIEVGPSADLLLALVSLSPIWQGSLPATTPNTILEAIEYTRGSNRKTIRRASWQTSPNWAAPGSADT